MKLSAFLLALVASLTVAASASAAVPKQCRYLGGKAALLPFPNDAWTKKDSASETGRRLNLPARCAPENAAGTAIDLTDQNRLDGFSPGSQLVLKVPGVNSPKAFKRSKLAPITDIAASLRRKAPIVILDANSRKRQAYWAELDANASRNSRRTILVHPAKNLVEGRRYVVVVRNLRTGSGKKVKPLKGMRKKRKSARLKSILALAKRAKIKAKGIHVAWEFTVGSEQSLQSRLLRMRDDAFAKLGDTDLADTRVDGKAPAFKVTGVEAYTPEENPQLLRRVTGTFQVPCYLSSPGCGPGGRLNLGADGLPAQAPGSEQTARFVCVIPRAAQQAAGRGSLYGHGLLGDADEATKGTSIWLMAQESNMTFCATDWSGMSTEDVGNTAEILKDLSKFPELADRLQQGILNFMYLGRLMRHPQGLSADPAFQVGDHAAFALGNLFYDGNSQGGILGGALTAVSPDFRRAVLGVPGMNFSLLLTRSSNWKTYGAVFNPAYPDEASRPLALSLIQLLWDRSESDGWAAHITSDPPPGTPNHEVLMHVARGDHQVTTAAADIMARTIGARANPNPLFPGVSDEKTPLWGIETIPAFPYAGSAIIYWEPGGGLARVPKQPLTNTPEHLGVDPHGDPRYTQIARQQKSAFLTADGKVIDVCNGGPCQAEKDPARP
ncbi:MAG TPA: hypothetical protein VF533_03985 [Solirubrobacteraceae bacterium]|jgi:hypothetical protein